MRLRTGSFTAILFGVLALLQLAEAQAVPELTPFSADMQMSSTAGGNAMHEATGKLYVSRQHMRMDMQGGPHGGAIVITNFVTKTSDMLMPEQHMFMEFNADQAMGRHMAPSINTYRDPSNPCAGDEGMTCKHLGTEQVNGRSCDHWQITDKTGKVSNVWIDQKLHFPIKTVSGDGTWQLTNIQEGEPAASLFEIPAGYQKMDMGGMMQGMQPPH